jgi:hypothetical protein
MFAFALWCLVLLHRVDDAHGRFGSRDTTLLPKPASDREKLRWNIPLDNWSRRDEILSAIALSARGGGNRPRSTGSPPSQQLEAWEGRYAVKVARYLLHVGWIIGAFLCMGCWMVSLLFTPWLLLLVGNKPLVTLIQVAMLLYFGTLAAVTVAESLQVNTRRNLYPEGWFNFLGLHATLSLLLSIVGTLMMRVLKTFLWTMQSDVGRPYIESALGTFVLCCILGLSTFTGTLSAELYNRCPSQELKSRRHMVIVILSLIAIWQTSANSLVDPTKMLLLSYSGYLLLSG